MPTSLAGTLRGAARQLLKYPGFSVVAVLTLALRMGATTALFSVGYGVLISPNPCPLPHEIWAPGVRSPTVEQRVRRYQLREFDAMAQLPSFSAVMANAFDFLGVARPRDCASGDTRRDAGI